MTTLTESSALPRLAGSEQTSRLKHLTKEQFDHWLEKGYLVVHDAVEADLVQRIIDDIFDFTARDPKRPETWFEPEDNKAGMIEMHGRNSLWAARQAPRIHEVFTDLWGTEELWMSVNRVNFNVPQSLGREREDLIHWDLDLAKTPYNPAIQGVLALSDCGEEDGTFLCVPGSHLDVAAWHESGCEGPRPTVEEIRSRRPLKRIPVKAGELILWNQGLIHGNGVNHGERARLAMYVHQTPVNTLRKHDLGLGKGHFSHALEAIDCWEWAGHEQALAEALGCRQKDAHAWAITSAKENRIQPLPEAAEASPLSPETRRAFTEMLEQLPLPDDRPYADESAPRTFSSGPRRSFFLCRSAMRILSSQFGIAREIEPEPLTALGRKLIGLEPWG